MGGEITEEHMARNDCDGGLTLFFFTLMVRMVGLLESHSVLEHVKPKTRLYYRLKEAYTKLWNQKQEEEEAASQSCQREALFFSTFMVQVQWGPVSSVCSCFNESSVCVRAQQPHFSM